jgi:CHAT domain-containing protein
VSVLLLVLPLHDTMPDSAQLTYEHAAHLFQEGYLSQSQGEAEHGAREFARRSLYWTSRFQLLSAESMLYRGMYDDALRMLVSYTNAAGEEGAVQKLAIEAVALARQDQVAAAQDRLAQADRLCSRQALSSCGEVLSSHAILAIKSGQLTEARQRFLDALAFAQVRNDQWLETTSKLNLGYIAMQNDHYDEAVDWLRSADKDSAAHGYKLSLQLAAGNLGWAYYQLGDRERALEQYGQAEASAEELGVTRYQLKWVSTIGYIYQYSGDWKNALDSYRRSLALAKNIASREDIVNALDDLAMVSADNGQIDQAADYLNQVKQIEGAGSKRSPEFRRTECVISAARGKSDEAEGCFRALQQDESILVSDRLDSGYRLAGLLQVEGKNEAAEQEYRSALDLYHSARATLRSEEAQLPFGTNASRIYDGYIHLLMREGRAKEALATADESRAETLERDLDHDPKKAQRREPASPQQIARRADATLLFYWLGEKQSYLWAITSNRIASFDLPPRHEIADHVMNYTRKIVQLHDPVRAGDRDGEALYKILVEPAAEAIQRAKQVIILSDGELSQLNFETLLVPNSMNSGPQMGNQNAQVHYLIDDATIVSAPSFGMLQAPQTSGDRGGKILLLGNPISPNSEFPALPLFGVEMSKIQSHFERNRVSVVAGSSATPGMYLASNPAQYSYIHFVSHAVANRIVPLDSAIVLSKSSADENSFKLYARDVIQHPIDAKLVTISACYGNGTRFYAGEGLVGLSWAFLHAGAQRVIGALWEVSDESTPRLMDALYANIAEGSSPEISLRKAKLLLLHSDSRFSKPFFWATFQIYDRQ